MDRERPLSAVAVVRVLRGIPAAQALGMSRRPWDRREPAGRAYVIPPLAAIFDGDGIAMISA
jgi:hypothetical protein